MKEQKIKAYEVVVKDGEIAFVLTIPARTKKEAEKYCAGNGEILLTREIKLPINTDVIHDELSHRFGKQELDIIIRILEFYYKDQCTDLDIPF